MSNVVSKHDYGCFMQKAMERLLIEISAYLTSRREAAEHYEPYLASDFTMLELFNLNEMDFSRVFAFLLDPGAKHYQGRLFLDAFLKTVDELPCLIENQDLRPTLKGKVGVTTEKYADENGRIDILIEGENEAIAIENKIHYAKDQDKQLWRYYDWLKNEKFKSSLLIYLHQEKLDLNNQTLGGDEEKQLATARHTVHMDFATLSQIFESTLAQIKAPNVRFFVECLVRYINTYVCGDNAMSKNILLDITKDDAEKINAVLLIHDNYDKYMKEVFDVFYQNLNRVLVEKRDSRQIKLGEYPNFLERWCPIRFFFDDISSWSFSVEACADNMNEICWGIHFVNPKDSRNTDEVITKLRNIGTKAFTEYQRNRSEWWPWWTWYKTSREDSSWYNGEIIQKMISGDPDFINSIIDKVIKLYDVYKSAQQASNNPSSETNSGS